jgi:ribonuclease-3
MARPVLADPSPVLARLGLEPAPARLLEALTHPSWSNERVGAPDNQRLEFLGDAVLGLCVSELLMERFPGADEGELSRMRSTLVSTEALAAFAREVGLGGCLRLGRGARELGEATKDSVLADALEALVGVTFAERGIDAARGAVLAIVGAHLDGLRPEGRDPKSELQERVQALGRGTPRYRVVVAEGPSHAPRFEVEVEVDGEVLGRGDGTSKKRAESQAAREALESPASRRRAEPRRASEAPPPSEGPQGTSDGPPSSPPPPPPPPPRSVAPSPPPEVDRA